MTDRRIFLVDNGSLRPRATFALRALAETLSSRIGHKVEAVSLLHSHKIAPDELNGVPATIVRRALREGIGQGHREFVFLPLFLGPSLAITDYLQKLIVEGEAMAPDLSARVAETLCGSSVEEPDPRLARILMDLIDAKLANDDCLQTEIALVDHGTPIESVNRLRNAVAAQLAQLLQGKKVASVVAASMERRDGPEYAFNDPLLETLSARGEVTGLLVAMFFLLPGRHAGPEGDVVEICEGMVARGQYKQVEITPLLGEHPLLVEILADRLEEVL